MIFIRNILIPVFIGMSLLSSAQINDSPAQHKEVKLNKAYIKSYFTDSWEILKSPLRWKGRQWGIFAAVSGVTILAYTQDDVIRDAFQRNRTHGADQASKYFLEPLGSGIITIPLAAGFWAFGELTDNKRAARAGLTGIKAMAITAVFTYTIKYATQRHRPYEDYSPDPRIWEGPFGSYTSTAFPSAHSSVVFAVATVFATEYKDKIWVPVMSYTLASLVAVSRVYDDKHWASDVILGSALGFLIGKFVYKSTVKNPNLVIIPGVSSSGHPGFTMIYQLR
ncbi:MAG: phosphatase PAP2 family protein [Bacteroidales bacterium]|nr:phosphatase PAP2 family protein [Bacteroidales bacterium]